MKSPCLHVTAVFISLCCFTACATPGAKQLAETSMLQAQAEIPEDQLLDVGIEIYTHDELSDRAAKKEGTNPDVRKAENHYMPYHLKYTLQNSGHWGMVRVLPPASDAADVFVAGEILESNGENLALRITISDASGSVWLEKRYKATLTGENYKENIPGQKDPFQGLYNAIANDMAAYRHQLTPDEIKRIRTISQITFARKFAPEAFDGYITEDPQGHISLNRLPSEDDPMMARVMSIRERDHMVVDTINEYYEGFYNDMWDPYQNWRALNLTERVALAEQKRDAFLRKAGGALLVVLAIGLDVSDSIDSGALTGAMVIAGGQVFMSGVNISQQAEMHYEALQELGESFGAEMNPVVLDLEGKKYELTGSAEQQYKRWRELLRKIYFEETGFSPP